MDNVEKSPENRAGAGEAEGRSPIPARIRNRRIAIGLTGSDLAARIGVSPSYISLIENGVKIPSSRVALDLARALDDDPDLYLAWVYSARQGGWAQTLRSSNYIRAYSSNPKARRRIASGVDLDLADAAEDQTLADPIEEELEDPAEDFDRASVSPVLARDAVAEDTGLLETTLGGLFPAAGRVQESARGFTLLEIPILEDGADPGRGDDVDEAGTIDTLFLDSRLFSQSSLRRPFAYRPSGAALGRVRRRVKPGDHVVLSSDVPALSPERILAVRFRGEVVLTRALFKKTALLLLPAEGATDFDVLELKNGRRLTDVVAGHVVLTVRRWT